MIIYCKYYDKCKDYKKQCKTCEQRPNKKMNESILQKAINNECKTIVLPDSSDWLERCKRCKYYDCKFYDRIHKGKLRQHTIVDCTNPKGTRFDNANCFEKAPEFQNIRKSRLPTATVDKMRTTKEENEKRKMVKLKVKKSISIDEGLHTGEIVAVEYRSEPYEYTDVMIQLSDVDVKLKYGCPTHLSETSKLGKLLLLFTKLNVGKDVDIDKVLIGKKVQFQTTNEVTKKGTFAKILDETIKAV